MWSLGWPGATHRATAPSPVTGTVDVDRQGRARALRLTIRQTGKTNVSVMTQVLTFSDFGRR